MTSLKTILTTKQQCIILLTVAFCLNFNTLFNDYTVDDETVITNNSFVQKGIKGIPEIICQNYFKGDNKINVGEFSGGRYRPFTLIVFAVEYQCFGANPFVSHLINVLLFTLLIALLFKLFHNPIFREKDKYLAFFSCLLFAVHPIHTEVIANVKSRDEMITFILLIISLLTFLKNTEKKNRWLFFTSMLCFFLALLTKETAITFIIIVPLILYFFFNHSVKRSVLLTIPLIIVFAGYALLRLFIIGIPHSGISDIVNAPFILATPAQAFATKVFILLKYLGLLIFPHPLSWEYGYNQIPYVELSSIQFIFSISVLIGLSAYAIYSLKKKTLISFCILYFFITISLVANFIADTGAPLAERFLFQPSLAFCIATASLYINIHKKSKVIATAFMLIILILFSVKSFMRNGEWKNNETLATTDVISSPNSIRANMAAAYIYLTKTNTETDLELKKEYLKKAAYYSERALKIHFNNPRALIDLEFASSHLFDYYDSVDLWLKACYLDPSQPEAKIIMTALADNSYRQGNAFFEKNNNDAAIRYYKKCVELNNKHTESWYNLGGNYYIKGDSINALKAWEKVKLLDPHHLFKKEDFLRTN